MYAKRIGARQNLVRISTGAGCGSLAAVFLSYCAFRLHFNLSSAGFVDLLVVVLVALRFGFWAATGCSFVVVACLDYFFAPPILSFHMENPQDWIALACFEITALIVSRLSIQAQEHMHDAVQHRRNAEKLYELSRSILLLNPQRVSIAQIAQLIIANTGLDSVAIFDSASAGLYAAGTFTEELKELARNAYLANADRDCPSPRQWQRVLRSGGKPIGGAALSGVDMTPLMADAIASLVASALERTHAFEKESRAEAARQSEQLRTTVLDSLAHAFKTPLAVILTSTSGLIEMGDLKPAHLELIQMIHEHGRHLSGMTTHLLRMAKLDASEIRLRLDDVSVSALAEGVLAKCADQLYGRPVRVCIPKDLVVLADCELIGTTIAELLINAVKYSQPGSPIKISAREQRDEGRVLISVHNEGSTIGAEERGRIFERFYRSPSTKHQAPGSGIGLYVAKRTAEAHRGTVWVSSDKETGTTFVLALPAHKREYEPASK